MKPVARIKHVIRIFIVLNIIEGNVLNHLSLCYKILINLLCCIRKSDKIFIQKLIFSGFQSHSSRSYDSIHYCREDDDCGPRYFCGNKLWDRTLSRCYSEESRWIIFGFILVITLLILINCFYCWNDNYQNENENQEIQAMVLAITGT